MANSHVAAVPAELAWDTKLCDGPLQRCDFYNKEERLQVLKQTINSLICTGAEELFYAGKLLTRG